MWAKTMSSLGRIDLIFCNPAVAFGTSVLVEIVRFPASHNPDYSTILNLDIDILIF